MEGDRLNSQSTKPLSYLSILPKYRRHLFQQHWWHRRAVAELFPRDPRALERVIDYCLCERDLQRAYLGSWKECS
jgi:hypothetical protein